MGSEDKKLRKTLPEWEARPIEDRECEEEPLSVTVVSLKDMPLEERRKEAKKPLYLTRYE